VSNNSGRDSPEEPTDIALEQHYSVQEIAALWGIDCKTARRLFEGEPGVFVFGPHESRYKRGKRSMRVPKSVVIRVHRDRSAQGRIAPGAQPLPSSPARTQKKSA
jgi:hypothetical protein